MCSRAVVIAGGRITADDTPVELALKGPDGTLGGAFRALTAAAERVEDRANLALSA
jgi:ABC-2 type transport system ATP-binding protein